MRTFGRVYSELGVPQWIEVQTDPISGLNDYVYTTALIQTLKLNLGESPFWGSWGIPAAQSVIQQIVPDYYTMLTQQRYSANFLSLVIARLPDVVNNFGRFTPTYRVNITTHLGVPIELEIPT